MNGLSFKSTGGANKVCPKVSSTSLDVDHVGLVRLSHGSNRIFACKLVRDIESEGFSLSSC